ncbi:MAG: hypothetical protein IIC20_08220 [Chloroflexi bacterium]|nr:hypothetical protein [Chloroflexota bacterium]
MYIEDSPAAQDLADEAFELRDQGRFADAVQKLQRVVDEYPHKLMPCGDRTYTDALLWVRRELLEDDRLLAAYRSSFGPAAGRAVGLAMPTAQSPIDPEALRDVVSRYNVTPAGLDAGFALCAYYLERAEGRDASGVLDELANHPDLTAHAGRYHFLRAIAGYLLADTAAYDAHRRALEQSGDQIHLAELEALVNRTHPPLRLTHGPPGQAPTPSTLPQSLDEPLWEIELTEVQSVNPNYRPDLRAVPAGLSVTRVIPAGDGSRVYVNLGDRVTAYDRASGWRLWEVTDRESDTARAAQRVVRGRQPMTEPRGVWTTGDRAFALLGWANPRQVVQPGLGGVVSLLGIDSHAGRVLWRVTPGDLDKSTFGHGGKYSFCIAEHEEASPWEPLHVQRGLRPNESAVTVFAVHPPFQFHDSTSNTPEGLLASAARSMALYGPNLAEIVIVWSPEHIGAFRNAGWTKRQAMEHLAEHAVTAVDAGQEPRPVVSAADDISMLVAGGDAGAFSIIIPPWGGGRISKAVTKPIMA